MKTGQVNPDRPLVGPSVDTFVGCFVGVPEGPKTGKSAPRGCSRGGSRGATRGPTRGPTRVPTRGSNFAFACSVLSPSFASANQGKITHPKNTHPCKICTNSWRANSFWLISKEEWRQFVQIVPKLFAQDGASIWGGRFFVSAHLGVRGNQFDDKAWLLWFTSFRSVSPKRAFADKGRAFRTKWYNSHEARGLFARIGHLGSGCHFKSTSSIMADRRATTQT